LQTIKEFDFSSILGNLIMIQNKINWLVVVSIGYCLLPTMVNAKETTVHKAVQAVGQPAQVAPQPLKIDKKRISYGIGVDIGRNFKHLGLDVNLDELVIGLKEAYAGKKLRESDEDLRVIVNTYQADLMQKQALALKATGEANEKAGEAFLAENGKKEGVVTLASGLQYRILKSGTGNKPTDSDIVECQYRGTLINGTEFDSSYRNGKPVFFNLSGGVIPGFKEGLKQMSVGSKWQFFMPPKLAYGNRGAGRDIGPNSTLIFEVELLGIKPSETKPSAS
jgi:FKBP-type peptidyl-prolyl cis-trans isomerase FklB